MAKRDVAIGLVGTTLDAGKGGKRWTRWRPTIALATQPDRPLARLELLVGIFGGELGYEGLRLGGVLYHGVHVSVALDVGVILYYLFAASDFLSSL